MHLVVVEKCWQISKISQTVPWDPPKRSQEQQHCPSLLVFSGLRGGLAHLSLLHHSKANNGAPQEEVERLKGLALAHFDQGREASEADRLVNFMTDCMALKEKVGKHIQALERHAKTCKTTRDYCCRVVRVSIQLLLLRYVASSSGSDSSGSDVNLVCEPQETVSEEWKRGILDCVANYAARLVGNSDPKVETLVERESFDTKASNADDPLSERTENEAKEPGSTGALPHPRKKFAKAFQNPGLLRDLVDTLTVSIQAYSHSYHLIAGDWQQPATHTSFGGLLMDAGWIPHESLYGYAPTNHPYSGAARRLDELWISLALAHYVSGVGQDRYAGIFYP